MEILAVLKLIMTKAKHVYARLEKDFEKNLKIGVNGGTQLHQSIREM